METIEVLKQRRAKYGDSYKRTDEAIKAFTNGDVSKLQPLLDAGLLSNWVIMLSKMNRAIYSPTHEDNWIDIAGYSHLQLRILNDDESLD